MNFHLTVIEPFGGYAKGDEITDPAEVARVLASENEHHVIKRAAPATSDKSSKTAD
ncbi:hypothetical protein RA280_15375 [Cupriavidus sp. CV2]|uniref:hypothetical protein n=1 Tax=Cupriavidus ulmosensis TaxID=3065913 RepID=UPI00296AEC0B|nr:hypothetical protein [Cupriavidus sp. CV2]MDW3683106.1 hypothetical protein [Cupriavidus sp. CV2]